MSSSDGEDSTSNISSPYLSGKRDRKNRDSESNLMMMGDQNRNRNATSSIPTTPPIALNPKNLDTTINTGQQNTHKTSESSTKKDSHPKLKYKEKIKQMGDIIDELKGENQSLRSQIELNGQGETKRVKLSEEDWNNLVFTIQKLQGFLEETVSSLERSKDRHNRLHLQLSSTHKNLSTLQSTLQNPNDLELSNELTIKELQSRASSPVFNSPNKKATQQDVFSLANEIVVENDELRKTISYIRQQLDTHHLRTPFPASVMQTDSPEKSLKKFEGENQELKDKLWQVQEKLSVTQRKLRAAQTVKVRYEQALERANAILDTQYKGSHVEEMTNRISQLETSHNELQTELNKSRQDEQIAVGECSRLHSICAELQKLLDTTTNALEEKSDDWEIQQQKIEDLEFQLTLSQKKIVDIQNKVDDIEKIDKSDPSKTDTTSDGYTAIINRLELQLDQSQQQNSQMTLERERQEIQLRAMTSEAEKLRSLLRKSEMQCQDLRDQISEKESKIMDLESARTNLNNTVFKAEQDVKHLNWQLKNLQSTEDKLKDTQKQLNFLQQQHLDLTQESTELHRQLSILAQERASIFSEISQMSVTCDQLQKVVSSSIASSLAAIRASS